jgi:predicted phosphodiesterase
MPQKPESIAAKARQLCREFPDTPTRALARKLYAANSEHITNLESARKAVLVVRGANGKKHQYKADPACARPKGKSGWKPACPPSLAEEWTPVQLDGPCNVLSLSDAHIPYHRREAIEAAVSYGKRLKPDVLLLNGDWADFYNVSRWEKDPKQRDLRGELDSVKQSLEWLRSQFKHARFIYALGNHEERFDKWIWNKAVELWNVEAIQLHNILDFERLGIERVDEVPVMAGKHLPILHGHQLLKGAFSPVNQARGAFLRTIHSNLTAHGHRTSTHCEPDMWGREITCWSQGALCNLRPPYARFPKWNWGFAHIEVASDSQFNMHNLRISEDFNVRAA